MINTPIQITLLAIRNVKFPNLVIVSEFGRVKILIFTAGVCRPLLVESGNNLRLSVDLQVNRRIALSLIISSPCGEMCEQQRA